MCSEVRPPVGGGVGAFCRECASRHGKLAVGHFIVLQWHVSVCLSVCLCVCVCVCLYVVPACRCECIVNCTLSPFEHFHCNNFVIVPAIHC